MGTREFEMSSPPITHWDISVLTLQNTNSGLLLPPESIISKTRRFESKEKGDLQ